MEILSTHTEKAPSTYTLDHNELADAICILGGEIQALAPLTHTQRQMLPQLTRITYLEFFILAAIGIAWNHNLLSSTVAIVGAIVSYGAFGFGCIYFGWGEMRAWSALRKAESRLGLDRTKYVSFVGWKEYKARLPVTTFAFLTFLLLMAAVLCREVFGTPNSIVDIAIALTCAAQAFSTKTLMFRNALRPLKRLQVAEQLRDHLQEQLNSSAAGEEQTFSIPEDEYKHIARMERALINLDRQRAIKQSAKKSEQVLLPVQQTAEVLQKKSMLDPEARLSVQAQIEELSAEPHPATAYAFGDGTWRLPVKDSSLEIKYVLDTGLKEIKVNDLVQSLKVQLRVNDLVEAQKANTDVNDMVDLLNPNSRSEGLE